MAFWKIASAKVLTGKRVGLVLMGGGAKCAYQVGVWKALWELGVRRFVSISGTSGGALNAVLIAGGPPTSAEALWTDIVAKGVLSKPADQRLRIALLIAAHILLLAPHLVGFSLLGWIWFVGLPGQLIDIYLVLAVITCCGGAAVLLSNAMRNMSSLGAVIPLFFMHWQRYRETGLALLAGGAFMFFLFASQRGQPEHYASGIWFWILLGIFPLFIGLFAAGYIIIVYIFRITPIFDRPELQRATARVLQQSAFPNCSGPVFACAAIHSSYVDPFKVPPGKEPMRRNPFTGEYEQAEWWKTQPTTGWVPRYIDVRGEPDANWLLNATSAIPFVFPCTSVPGSLGSRSTYVDGGVADNCPVLPILSEPVDVIIVIGVNHEAPPSSPDTYRAQIEVLLRRYFFSQSGNLDEASKIRDNWIRNLDPIEKQLATEFSGPIDRLMGWDRSDFSTPQLSPPIDNIDFLFIQPSLHTACPIPGLNQLTGTMRFDPCYIARLQQLGYDDAKTCVTP